MSSNLDRIEAEAKEHIAVRDQHYAEYGEEHFCEDYGCHNMGRFAVDVLALVNVAKAAQHILANGKLGKQSKRRLREALAALDEKAGVLCTHTEVSDWWGEERGHPTHYRCLTCNDLFPVIGDTDLWKPVEIRKETA